MKKEMSVTAYVGIEDVREYLEGLHAEMISSHEQTRCDAGMDATVITNVMASILCTEAESMHKGCMAYKQLSECFYQEDINRSIDEVVNYLSDGGAVMIEHETRLVDALKGVTDPKSWAEIAAESWSDADKWKFIRTMLSSGRGYHDNTTVVEEVIRLSEMY